MNSLIEVKAYSIDELKRIFALYSHTNLAIVDNKRQVEYFDSYFGELNPKTIVVENFYIDRDFLNDFSKYYVRCFQQVIDNKYKSRCIRLHFFSIRFTDDEFISLINNNSDSLTIDELNEAYKGFIVVKPIPCKFVGRSCLVTYGTDGGRRHYSSMRDYNVGLYGIPLTVKNTMAFQEQDSVVAACATSALWSVFQITGKELQHCIPTPVEITELATQLPEEMVPGTLPNTGLMPRQMIYAIRQLDLDPRVIDARSFFLFKSALYAYLKLGFPMILTMILRDTSPIPLDDFAEGAGHAVAVSGYSLGSDCEPYGETGFKLRATRINEIYVHDDQVGPFAWMKFDNIPVTIEENNEDTNYDSLLTSWIGGDGNEGSIRAIPDMLIIPRYPKIRINIDHILNVVIAFNRQIRAYISNVEIALPYDFEWDIFLSKLNSFRHDLSKELVNYSHIDPDVLLQPMPRFLWRAVAYDNSNKIMELVFDATDFEKGEFFLRGISYNQDIFNFIIGASLEYISDYENQREIIWPILKWFSEQE